MRSNTKGLAKSMTEMGEVGKTEIQRSLRNAAHLAAFNRLAAGEQALFPDLRDRRFLVTGESARDGSRGHMMRLDVRQHVGTQYYERYVIATATLLVETGVITQEELNQALGSHFKLANPPHSNGRPAITGRPPFEVGDRVLVRDEYFAGHVRMPAYVRGKEGVIQHRTTEKWPFPDAIGHGDTTAAHQPTYHVEFRVKDLWGDAADDGFVVVDLFESYLDKVDAPTAQAVKA